jgi:hypothetical protein
VSKINTGGPAFPHMYNGIHPDNGMNLRDWFAGQAPEPSKDWIDLHHSIDRSRNPHNDSYKPRIRETIEIIASYKYAYADAMLAERERQS